MLGFAALDNIKMSDDSLCLLNPEEARPRLKVPATTAAPGILCKLNVKGPFKNDFKQI